MSENPYQAPQATSDGSRLAGSATLSPAQRDRLLSIARAQKLALACIPLGLCTRVMLFFAADGNSLEQPLVISCAAFAVALFTAACIGWLAARVYGRSWGILAGSVAMLPCLALIALLIVNYKATTVLSRHGLRLSLAGAKVHSDLGGQA